MKENFEKAKEFVEKHKVELIVGSIAIGGACCLGYFAHLDRRKIKAAKVITDQAISSFSDGYQTAIGFVKECGIDEACKWGEAIMTNIDQNSLYEEVLSALK